MSLKIYININEIFKTNSKKKNTNYQVLCFPFRQSVESLDERVIDELSLFELQRDLR